MKRLYWISLLCVIVSCFILISILHAGASTAKTLTKKCPMCNKLFSEETKFCGDDGTKLIELPVKMVCPECKKEGTPGEKFCKEHGKKLVPLAEIPPTQDADTLKQKKELAKKYYKEGNDYCDAESYDLAIESYKKAEEAFPDFPALHYNMGWLYSKLGNAEQSIRHLQKYIVLAPDASDITEVQSYVVVLKNAVEKRKQVMDAFKNRDEIMKKALIEQKQKYGSVLVPEGEFIMGTNDAREDAYPEHKVYLDAFEIDRYEVTNAQYWEFLEYMKKTNDHSKCFKGEPSGKDHTPRFWDNEYYNVPDYPVVRIDWYDAYAYAAWAGKRLPTEAEWEKAARGLDGRKFPWGNEWDPARCNLSGEPKPVGSVESGKSVYGCYDIAGSVYEWCADWYLDTYYAESPHKNPKGPDNGLRRVIRGGSRFSQPFQVRTNTRKSEQPNLFNLGVGFRCAKDVKEK
ncbi:MAG: tetratricopeptide repeat protein [Candidatus Brocadia sp. AMX2]|uniref:Sulfatase-modifying factor enzyme-like domain-containing protein n=1 Tax=Candidatus Brocadia sinica JPN1 TaxID=1197129 RepID=A0ABQ0JTS8_9BACT|nr:MULTISPECIES: SUMF1/EgtB/PvdO family nonheme iron enzyme [Brocadia]MBC6933403.1 tetratricopeptide repeat protein [Candidatus Brocadia sp.]MBL1170259.1 tetratricopeptide repeat protein [Candidatus Brocadia sp. AMX1]MCK6469594.1 SUMF1/EgtB/PvdO family nonheme iron enzyme [Candidatus Brocadia sinica]NOG40032.1 SUMF1/EgtB/PvdO family nonheme iron enzyme [Planctomycetota bacterium]KAA0244385.1 MAG: tetratricopeptide repeat protein [Candidatus Brocadia sp. AMX2]